MSLIAIGLYCTSHLPQSIFPQDPNGTLLIQMDGAPTDTIDALKQKTTLFKKFYRNNTISYYWINISNDALTGQLKAFINLRYRPQYLHQTLAFADTINAFIKKNKILNASASTWNFSSSGDNYDLEFNIYDDGSIAHINRAASVITQTLKNSPMFSTVSNTINYPKKQLGVVIDLVKAARIGLYQNDLTNLLSIYYGGFTLDNDLTISGLNVPVVVQLDASALTNPHSFDMLTIFSPKTQRYYPLTSLASLKLISKPTIISTFNGDPTVTIQANLNKGYSLSDAIPYVNSVLAAKTPFVNYQYQNAAFDYLQGNTQTILITCFGIACIYLLLATLFKSLIDPLIILLTVPFSLIGGALMLYVIHSSLNIYSILALLTLIGLITKHGVLIVQFANEGFQQGLSAREAVLKATQDRFRPIIMTTLAMTLGALPLILSNQLMYMAKRNLGIVLLGGLIIGTLFSLFVVPLVYTLIKTKHELLRSIKKEAP